MFYKSMFSAIFLGSFSFASSNFTFDSLETFKANFIQTIKSTENKNIEYKGEVFIKNSGNILWKYKTPIVKNVYVNSNYVIIDEPQLEQAIYTSLQDDINLIEILKQAKKTNENEYLANIEGVDYKVYIKNSKIEKITYNDKLENFIIINFTEVINNSMIDDNIFKFLAPDYYDIIRK